MTDISSCLKEPSPQDQALFGGARFITWCLWRPFLGEGQWCLRHFWECWVRFGQRSCARTHLKKALRPTRAFGGALGKYRSHLVFLTFRHTNPICHHHHLVQLARISLTLCHYPSLSSIASGWSSRLHPVSIQINSSWLSYICASIWRGPKENVPYEIVLALSRTSCSSNLDVLWDGR